ncbi:MAG: diaminopimelate epimerase, partial [Coriobacteriales bacterium]|nr:diaminopimelate epimerase [Coriobacteriales bacterium]
MKLDFAKIHGAGNDFIIIEDLSSSIELAPEQIQQLCDRHLGIGADGVILVRPSEHADCVAYMHYFNSDGTLAEMCGNGVRCFAKFLVDFGFVRPEEGAQKGLFAVDTAAGKRPLQFTVDDEGKLTTVTVDMGEPIFEPDSIPTSLPVTQHITITTADRTTKTEGAVYLNQDAFSSVGSELQLPNSMRMTCVNMGNPHLVIFLDESIDLPNFDIERLGTYFEKAEQLFPEGTNVEFAIIEKKEEEAEPATGERAASFDGHNILPTMDKGRSDTYNVIVDERMSNNDSSSEEEPPLRVTHITMRVWERGCGETLACGTGACAAAVAAVAFEGAERNLVLHLLGGDLAIEWGSDNHVYMTGPAKTVYQGSTEIREKRVLKTANNLNNIAPYLFAQIDKKRDLLCAQGVDVISLGIGDPDQPTPKHIVDAMAEAIRKPVNHQYPDYAGSPAYRAAAAAWMNRRFGVNVDPDTETLALIGSKEGIAHIHTAFVNPGDYVLAPSIGYPVYSGGATLMHANTYFMPMSAKTGWLASFYSIPEDILAQAKIMFLGYPNNPTGAIASEEYFDKAIAFCMEHDLLLVHDNAYSEIGFDGYVAPSILERPDAKEVAIEMFSLSKSYNMTGWRIGFAVGNADAIQALGTVKNNLDSGQFTAIQDAAIVALEGSQQCVADMCALYQHRRDLVVEALRAIGLECEAPKATIYVWAKVPEGYSSAEFAERLLVEAHVIVTPGSG